MVGIRHDMSTVELLLFVIDVGYDHPHDFLDMFDSDEVRCCF